MHIRHWLVFVVSPQTRPNCDCVTQSPDFNAAQVCAAFADDLRTVITACLFSTTCLLLSTSSHLPFPLNRVASPEGMPSAPTFSRHLPSIHVKRRFCCILHAPTIVFYIFDGFIIL